MREREIDFAGELGVLAPLQSLNLIPQPLAVLQKLRCAGRQQDIGENDAAPSAVLMKLSGAFVAKALACAIGCCGNSRLSSGPADDLNREMIARHVGAMRRVA